jgi:hypothetical protein
MADLKGFSQLDNSNASTLEGLHYGIGYKCKAGKAAIQCLKCGDGYILGPCPNCGGLEYESGISTTKVIGLFCKTCQKGFTYTTCTKCGCENPVNRNTFRTKGCYIVTATAGYNSKELDFFYFYRDNYLTGNKFGELFIKFYYSFSFQLAGVISRSNILKKLTYLLIVKPCYQIIKIFCKKKV